MREKRMKMREMRSVLIFVACTVISGAAAMFGVNVLPVMAAESVGEEMVVSNDAPDTGEGESSVNALNAGGDENLGVYNFKDNKTTGTVTVTKVWDDNKTNEEREIPDIKVSTAKPGKNPLGYTITFHGDKDAGLVFNDGSDVNDVIYNSSGNIVEGGFKAISEVKIFDGWYSDKKYTKKIEIDENGLPVGGINDDLDLYAKAKIFEIKGYNGDYSKKYNDFNYLIPNTVTEIIFTDEIKPAEAKRIDVNADGSAEVIAWTENNGTVMKVSTQIKGVKVQAAKNSRRMFYERGKLTNIDFSMLDTSKVVDIGDMFYSCYSLKSLDLTGWNTSNVTNMSKMFEFCKNLTSLDMTGWNTSNVTNMQHMFSSCSGLTALDLSPLNTQNVTDMSDMFFDCSGLTALNLSSLNTQNVTSVSGMFQGCSGLTALDLSPLNTQNVTDMSGMFHGCSGLTALDLSPLNASNVTNMNWMFSSCSGLTSLDLTPLNTSNVTDMSSMFYYCSGLTSLDMTPLDTSKVTNMQYMFCNCSGLTSLDLTPLDTSKVTNMQYMFSSCSGLTSLDLTPLDTSKVTNMSGIFHGCSGLTSLDLTPLDTSKVMDMRSMFNSCSGLKSLNLSRFDTSNVTNMDYMFEDCCSLISLDLRQFDTSNMTNMYCMERMFGHCDDLTTLFTGSKFKFVGSVYGLSGTWQNTAGETFTLGHFPSNVDDIYRKISNLPSISY